MPTVPDMPTVLTTDSTWHADSTDYRQYLTCPQYWLPTVPDMPTVPTTDSTWHADSNDYRQYLTCRQYWLPTVPDIQTALTTDSTWHTDSTDYRCRKRHGPAAINVMDEDTDKDSYATSAILHFPVWIQLHKLPLNDRYRQDDMTMGTRRQTESCSDRL